MGELLEGANYWRKGIHHILNKQLQYLENAKIINYAIIFMEMRPFPLTLLTVMHGV